MSARMSPLDVILLSTSCRAAGTNRTVASPPQGRPTWRHRTENDDGDGGE